MRIMSQWKLEEKATFAETMKNYQSKYLVLEFKRCSSWSGDVFALS